MLKLLDLPYIDLIVEKTQLLARHPSLSNHVHLIQCTLYLLMRNGFDFDRLFHESDCDFTNDKILSSVLECLLGVRTKLAAAFARVRVERRAAGREWSERLQNVLSAEERAAEEQKGIICLLE